MGAHGYGTSHLRAVTDLAARGWAELAAVVDPRPVAGTAADELVPDGTPWFADLDALLASDVPDVIVVATPIHTHASLAVAAMRAGADVLLEKPTAVSLDEHALLVDVAAATGQRCQVGFQTFGSGAPVELARLVSSGELGDVVGVGAVGTWVRTAGYYARSRWAGRRTLDGVPVVDGVVTNPLAHAVATALKVAGATRAEHVTDVAVDLHRARGIEADDTSSLVAGTTGGLRVAAGLTLAASVQSLARVVVRGTLGSATLRYERDELVVTSSRGTRTVRTARTELLDDLVAVRGTDRRLLCPVEETGAFMTVLDAVRSAPPPALIAPEHVTWLGAGDERRPVVRDVEQWCERVAVELDTFAALGAPWAVHADQARRGREGRRARHRC